MFLPCKKELSDTSFKADAVLTNCCGKPLLFFQIAIIAHVIKGRKTVQNAPNPSTRHGAIPDAARSVGRRRTRHLATPPVASEDSPSQKVCKNAMKQPFLQGADAIFQLSTFNFQLTTY